MAGKKLSKWETERILIRQKIMALEAELGKVGLKKLSQALVEHLEKPKKAR